MKKDNFQLKQFFSIFIILYCSTLPCFAQQTQHEKPSKVDTIKTQVGTLIISRFETSAKKSEKILRTRLKVIVRDEQSNRLLPLSFVGINKAMFQTGENANAIIDIEKGKYKLSANSLGYNTLVSRLKISLHYNYEVEILLIQKKDLLY